MEELVCTTTDILRHSESDCPPTITTPCRNKLLSQLRLNFDMTVLKETTLMRCYSDIFCPSQPFFYDSFQQSLSSEVLLIQSHAERMCDGLNATFSC